MSELQKEIDAKAVAPLMGYELRTKLAGGAR